MSRLMLLIGLFLLGFGCRTASTWTMPSSVIGYSDAEVFSGAWTNSNGRVMGLISSFVQSSKNGGDFMIATVGDRRSNEAYWCEIYQVTHTENWNSKRKYNINYRLARTGDMAGHFLVGGVKMNDYTNKVIVSIDLRVTPGFAHVVSPPATLPFTAASSVREPGNEGVLCGFTITKDFKVFEQGQMAYSGGPQLKSNEH